MAEPTITRRYGLLATSFPAGGTPTRLYTAPGETQSTPGRTGRMASAKIRIANNGAATTFGIWFGNADQVRGTNGTVAYPTVTQVGAAGGGIGTLPSVIELIAGDGLENAAWIDVQSGNGNVSFQLFGEEVTIDP